jgi:hypothetical protein
VLAWLAEDSLNARQIVTTLAIQLPDGAVGAGDQAVRPMQESAAGHRFLPRQSESSRPAFLVQGLSGDEEGRDARQASATEGTRLAAVQEVYGVVSRAETGTLVYCADACFRNRKAVTPVYEQRDAKSSRARAVARADLPGNHLTRMQAHPQPQLDTVRAPDMGLLTAEGASDGRVEVVPPCCDLAVGDFEDTHDRHRYLDTVLTA